MFVSTCTETGLLLSIAEVTLHVTVVICYVVIVTIVCFWQPLTTFCCILHYNLAFLQIIGSLNISWFKSKLTMESQFEVEKVVDKRIRNGNVSWIKLFFIYIFKTKKLFHPIQSIMQVEYLLKWTNWSSVHNSWQDEQYLNCTDLIRKYEDNAI